MTCFCFESAYCASPMRMPMSFCACSPLTLSGGANVRSSPEQYHGSCGLTRPAVRYTSLPNTSCLFLCTQESGRASSLAPDMPPHLPNCEKGQTLLA